MDKNKLIIENKGRIEAMANKLKAEYSLSDDMVMDLVSDGCIYRPQNRSCTDLEPHGTAL